MISSAEETARHEQRLASELRRGVVALAVLSALQTPSYGYSLQQVLADRGFDVEQGTLYPLLRRLDELGLLASEWNLGDTRPRKYYRLSDEGAAVLSGLKEQWKRLVQVVDGLLGPVEDATQAPGSPLGASTHNALKHQDGETL